ncbi:sterol regulatory element-binding protein cleavage-activating protein isoform X2 [Petromyzon marinus]|uniref:sterol regulatory element-binding protein cleavage-activating protein isoform X2 n=1 Tax=Petromyzon marinus TaxID=7757 RepID=UPI003F720A26
MMLAEKLKEKISQGFYSHGLMCASYPVPIIAFTFICVLACCSPLLKLPLPGTGPVEFVTPVQDYSPPDEQYAASGASDSEERPSWYVGRPVAYVQQVVLKATVFPWERGLIPVDAFRGPLSKVFELLEEIHNHQQTTSEGPRSLDDYCFRVAALLPGLRALQHFLPEHGCLVVSPANFWLNDIEHFRADPDVMSTVHQHQGKAFQFSTSLKDLLFGVPPKYSGVSRYYIRNRQRLVSFAVTIVLHSYDNRFVWGLRSRLKRLYPATNASLREDSMVHVHFQEEVGVAELVPLVTTYIILFAYIYFSTRKIDLVKSKWGLALAAVATVISSLLISVGLCTLFGLTPTLNGGEIFPYLVLVIGLENILVLTKSVVSTPVDQDVKFRIAQGLSNEGWSIVKNMATELFIVLIGYFTMVPAIQEFCLFALVGIVSDFFLQMFFFTTVLAIDIRRMELSDLHKHPLRGPPEALHVPVPAPAPRPRSKAPRGPAEARTGPQPPVSFPYSISLPPPSLRTLRLPRRLRVVYFFARTRLAQRVIMLGTVVWIGILVYTDPTGLRAYIASRVAQQSPLGGGDLTRMAMAGLFSHETPGASSAAAALSAGDAASTVAAAPGESGAGREPGRGSVPPDAGPGQPPPAPAPRGWESLNVHAERERPPADITWSGAQDEEVWRQLSFRHWPTLFSYYNISLARKYISILPVVPVSVVLSPEDALALQHPMELEQHRLALQHEREKAALPVLPAPTGLTSYYRAAGVGFLVGGLLVLTTCCLYKLLCPKTYGQLGPRHGRRRRRELPCDQYGYCPPVSEATPVPLTGHPMDIECVAVDGGMLVSCCLAGQIRVWDAHSGRCVTVIHRASRRRKDWDGGCDRAEAVDGCVGPRPWFETADAQAAGSLPASPLFGDRSSPTSPSHDTPNSPSSGYDFSSFCHPRFDGSPNSIPSGAHSAFSFAAGLSTDSYEPPSGSHRRTQRARDSSVEQGLHDASAGKATARSPSLPKARLQADSSPERSCGEPSEVACRSPRGGGEGDELGLGAGPGPPADEAIGPESCHGVIWSMAVKDGIVVVGCGNGRLEVWDAQGGTLHCCHEEGVAGIIALSFSQNNIVAARLNGTLDFFLLETSSLQGRDRAAAATAAPATRDGRRPPVLRAPCGDGEGDSDGDVSCRLMHSVCPAHHKPITTLRAAAGRVVTGSEDHTLKVFKLEDSCCLFTLRGHQAGVTTAYLDQSMTLCSGGRDGAVCLWDALTGSRVSQMYGHRGDVVCLSCTASYVISAGVDDKLCVWDRCSGSQLFTILQEPDCGSSFAVLAESVLVTGAPGCLSLWELAYGALLQTVCLPACDELQLPRALLPINSTTVACHLGSSLKLVQLPSVVDKLD